MPASAKRVGLLLASTGSHFSNEVVTGVMRYRAAHSWKLYDLLPEHLTNPVQRAELDVDGIIAMLSSELLFERYRPCERLLPLVNVVQTPGRGVVYVAPDNEAAGALAARTLLDQGWRRFGYVGLEYTLDNTPRLAGFRRTIREAGFECAPIQLRTIWYPPHDRQRELERLTDWLDRQPRPLALLAFSDAMAAFVLEAAHELGLRAPRDLAVIGIDDAPQTCELSDPPLTSINMNLEQVGFEAARTLDAMMAGEPIESRVVPVRGVIERGSTGLATLGDPDLAAAIRFMHQHMEAEIQVADIVKHVKLSRRQLYRKFDRLLGRTPIAELWRLRCNRAIQLLNGTDHKLAYIAAASGFKSVAHLSRMVKKHTGHSPRQLRLTPGRSSAQAVPAA